MRLDETGRDGGRARRKGREIRNWPLVERRAITGSNDERYDRMQRESERLEHVHDVSRTGRYRRQNDDGHAHERDEPARHGASSVCGTVGDSSTAAGFDAAAFERGRLAQRLVDKSSNLTTMKNKWPAP